MKKMKIMLFMISMLYGSVTVHAMSSFVNSMKGLGHGFEKFGETIGSAKFWEGMGRGFGAAPTGYVYSCKIINDTSWPISVTTQQYASFMGATFPKGGRAGIDVQNIAPFQQDYSVKNRQYYFEIRIDSPRLGDGGTYSGMPYVADALYTKDCIQLPKDKNSTKVDYFRVYMGKGLNKGVYRHQPLVEYIGYQDPKHPKDKHASVKKVDTLTGSPALVVYNSTDQAIQIGYSSKRIQGATTLKQSDCDLIWEVVEPNSFAIRSGDSVASSDKKKSQSSTFPLGTFGVFDIGLQQASQVYTFPVSVFDGQTYTLEVYQDEGADRQIGSQALQAAHDVPSNRVRDITPVTCVFWHESVKQLGKKSKGMVDVPGNVWVIAPSDDGMMKTIVKAGDALKFTFTRPQIDQKSRLYFVYVDEPDQQKEEAFIDRFAKGQNGQSVLQKYQKQSQKQFDKAQTSLKTIVTFAMNAKNDTATKPNVEVPENLLIAAMQGALKVDGGEIIDKELGVSGYLLGTDVFLSSGLGASNTYYYQLAPAQKSGATIIKSIVQNLYTQGQTDAPKGMPTPTTYTKPQIANNIAPELSNQPSLTTANSDSVVSGLSQSTALKSNNEKNTLSTLTSEAKISNQKVGKGNPGKQKAKKS